MLLALVSGGDCAWAAVGGFSASGDRSMGSDPGSWLSSSLLIFVDSGSCTTLSDSFGGEFAMKLEFLD